MDASTVSQLQAVLTEHEARLAALPGVTGWGVGLDGDEPVVHVFVAAAPSDDLVRELAQLLDRFEVIVESRPSEAC